MLWVKAGHVIAVIAWMAGLLYLPRLFVYHADAATGSHQAETFKVMERRLYRAIMTPAMAAAWVFGLWMVIGFDVVGFDIGAGWGWVWVKGLFVLALTFYHFWLGMCLRRFAADRNSHPSGFYRAVNEIPTLLMIVIVICVIVRPF